MSDASPEKNVEKLPWEQLPGEPKDVYLKFLEYARPLGSDYTTRRAYLVYQHEAGSKGIPLEERDAYELWTVYAHDWQWEARAFAWSEDERKMYEAVYRKRRFEVAERDWTTGGKLRDFASSVLNRMRDHEVGGKDEEGNTMVRITVRPVEVSQMLKTATDLQRLAVGEPTENIGYAQSGVEIYLPSNERPGE